MTTPFETERLTKDGRRIPVSVTISPVRNDHGHIIGASKIARDLTARYERERRISELQDELIHVSRLTELGQMVSALAHEVNQPLTAVNENSARRRNLSRIRAQGRSAPCRTRPAHPCAQPTS